MKVPSTEGGRFSIQSKSRETPEDAVRVWNSFCVDIMDVGFGFESLLQGAMGDAANSAHPENCGLLNGSQSGPTKTLKTCPAKTPMCRDGDCINPHCPDVVEFCKENTLAGVLRATALPA